MSYITVQDLKLYLNVDTGSDDVVLGQLIASAQKAVESYTRRVFEAGAAEARKFTVGVNTDGRVLWLDDDLLSITSVKTNFDSASPITILSTQYVTRPRTRAPYYAIELLGTTSVYWRYTSAPENGVEVNGVWAYSATPPLDIVQATRRWAGHMYRQRDAQVFDVTAFPDQGQILVPQSMPKDVKVLLDPYRRAVL